MRLSLPSIILLLTCFATEPASAQEEAAPEYRVPDRLYEPDTEELAELRQFTTDKWLGVRTTRHQLYGYVRGAAAFRAYVHFCKRHDLNVDMKPINRLAVGNLVEITSAHFEEPQWGKLAGLSDDAIRAFLSDQAQDVYAFEFAHAIEAAKTAQAASGETTVAYCKTIEHERYQDYIGLLATARRQGQ